MADARETIFKVDAVSVGAAIVGAHSALVGISGSGCGSGGSGGFSFGGSLGLRLSLGLSSLIRFGGGFLSCCGHRLRSCGRCWLHEAPNHVETIEVSSGIRLELDDEVVSIEDLAFEPSSLDGVIEPWVVNVAKLFKEVAVVGAVWNICLDSESLELVDVHAHLSCGFAADDESKMVPLAMFVLSWSARAMSWVSRVSASGAIRWSLLFNIHLQDLDEHSSLFRANDSPSTSGIGLVRMVRGEETAWSVGNTAVLEDNWSGITTVTADSSSEAGNVLSSFNGGIESFLSSLGTVSINVGLFDESTKEFLISQGCCRGEKSNSKLHRKFFFKSKGFSKKVQ